MQALRTTPTSSPSPHQLHKLLRAEMIDASSFSTPYLRLEYAEDAVAFLAIDADETGPPPYGRLCSHPIFCTPRFYAAPPTTSPANHVAISLSCHLTPSRT